MIIKIPMRVKPIGNSRGHWRAQAGRIKAEIRQVQSHLLAAGYYPGTCNVTKCQFTYIGPRRLDDDNLMGAFKSCRDGIARFFSVNDSIHGPIKWEYAQRLGRPHSIEISLE